MKKLEEKKKEEEKKKDDMKKEEQRKKRFEHISSELQKISSYVYEGVQDFNKKMGEVKDHIEVVVTEHTDRIVRTVVEN